MTTKKTDRYEFTSGVLFSVVILVQLFQLIRNLHGLDFDEFLEFLFDDFLWFSVNLLPIICNLFLAIACFKSNKICVVIGSCFGIAEYVYWYIECNSQGNLHGIVMQILCILFYLSVILAALCPRQAIKIGIIGFIAIQARIIIPLIRSIDYYISYIETLYEDIKIWHLSTMEDFWITIFYMFSSYFVYMLSSIAIITLGIAYSRKKKEAIAVENNVTNNECEMSIYEKSDTWQIVR